MIAAVIDRYGSPDVFRILEVDPPPVDPDSVLIKVKASSVNPIDFKVRKGLFRIKTNRKFPKILGFDVSGIVSQAGKNVQNFKVGDAVYTRLTWNWNPGGAYAEIVSAKADIVALMPPSLSYEEAAAIPLAGLTALQALRNVGKISAGHHVLINGASGGVGSFAVQIAKAFEARVTAVCSSRNAEFVRSLGADRIIDYAREKVTAVDEPVDIVFDTVGTSSLFECNGS